MERKPKSARERLGMAEKLFNLPQSQKLASHAVFYIKMSSLSQPTLISQQTNTCAPRVSEEQKTSSLSPIIMNSFCFYLTQLFLTHQNVLVNILFLSYLQKWIISSCRAGQTLHDFFFNLSPKHLLHLTPLWQHELTFDGDLISRFSHFCCFAFLTHLQGLSRNHKAVMSWLAVNETRYIHCRKWTEITRS